jgi:hypothetical protein
MRCILLVVRLFLIIIIGITENVLIRLFLFEVLRIFNGLAYGDFLLECKRFLEAVRGGKFFEFILLGVEVDIIFLNFFFEV